MEPAQLTGLARFRNAENERRMTMRGKMMRKWGFSLVEMMVVISIIGILTAIAVPKFTEVQRKSKESALRTNLQVYRSATYVFFSDTGLYPASLNDLAATTQPASGLTPTAAVRSISPGTWRGPYVQQVQFDPVSGEPLLYSVANGTVGSIRSSASGSDSNGVAFSTY